MKRKRQTLRGRKRRDEKRGRERNREREDMNSVSITPLPFTLQHRLGPPTGRLGGGGKKTPTPTIHGKGKQPCQFVT